MNKQLLALFLTLSNHVPYFFTSKLENLREKLAKASIKITFQAYIGLIAFASLLAGVITLVLSLLFSSIALPILSAIVLSIFTGFISAMLAAVTCILYPSLAISSRARKIDANLPLTANFMAVLASSGMPPERIFRSLANVGDEFGVGAEMRRTIGDIELLGLDLNGALKNASKRSPSKRFAALLDGVVTTSHMGGDLASYLRDESDKFKKARMSSMKSFLESLGGMAEVYVSFMIALPLALVVMLTIMSFLGGGAAMMGNLDPEVVLTLLTFVVTPAGVGMMILLVDSMTPPR
ncbi:MAG: type II secretion system F family protein [Candidatus Bathyarchaeota archaeon]|nr:type II secretion system F family protein [Candidatus Bathyarchaeota archaeon]